MKLQQKKTAPYIKRNMNYCTQTEHQILSKQCEMPYLYVLKIRFSHEYLILKFRPRISLKIIYSKLTISQKNKQEKTTTPKQ